MCKKQGLDFGCVFQWWSCPPPHEPASVYG